MNKREKAFLEFWDEFRRLSGRRIPDSEIVPTPKEIVRETQKAIARSARKRGEK